MKRWAEEVGNIPVASHDILYSYVNSYVKAGDTLCVP
jgi:hypothetical protein